MYINLHCTTRVVALFKFTFTIGIYAYLQNNDIYSYLLKGETII